MKRHKIQRGSSWCEYGDSCRIGLREYCGREVVDSILGFRIVMRVRR